MSERSIYHVADLPGFASTDSLNRERRQLEADNALDYRVEWLVSDQRIVDQLTALFKEQNMEIIKNNIDEMMREMNYVYRDKYPDNQLNSLYNKFIFLDEYENKIKGIKNTSLKMILYSKYYWFSRLADKFHEVYGFDAGIDQHQSKILDEIDQRLENIDWNVEWDFVEKLKYGTE